MFLLLGRNSFTLWCQVHSHMYACCISASIICLGTIIGGKFQGEFCGFDCAMYRLAGFLLAVCQLTVKCMKIGPFKFYVVGDLKVWYLLVNGENLIGFSLLVNVHCQY